MIRFQRIWINYYLKDINESFYSIVFTNCNISNAYWNITVCKKVHQNSSSIIKIVNFVLSHAVMDI